MSDTDTDLISRYTREHSEDAFAELVRRHLSLVYASALRQLRSPHLAEEAAQSTFLDLSRQASTLKPNTILSAWLYRVTRCKAIDIIRRETSRHAREQIASQMNASNTDDTPGDWNLLEPFLDEAMDTLDETDRAAVILRYFDNKSLRDVGQKLGSSENAAQKRITRAIDRLRQHLAKRGVTIASGTLAAVIAANGAPSAPIALAATITSAAALTTATFSPAAATTVAFTMKKFILATIAASTLVGVVEETRISSLQTRVQTAESAQTSLLEKVAALDSEHASLSNRLIQIAAENQAIKTGGGELHRLRAEVTRLHGEVTHFSGLASDWGQANEALRLQLNSESEKVRALTADQQAPAPNQPRTPAEQCIDQLHQLEGATEQYALEHKALPSTQGPPEEIAQYIRGLQIPRCPSGGVYTFGKVDTIPTCSIPGHTL